MKLMERIRTGIRSFSIEAIAIWFAFWDRRIRWYKRALLALPILYVLSPVDLVSDMIPIWGQADDIVVLRISYLLIRKFLPAEALAENRERAAKFWHGRSVNRIVFWITTGAVWGFAILVLARYLYRKLFNHL